MAHTLSNLSHLQSISERYGCLLPQAKHRNNILTQSAIKDGDRILEIGCGQGDCTMMLALTYPNSTIIAIDPAPLDYGAPETLGQAQSRIKSYPFGHRIVFMQTSPVEYLAGLDEGAFDIAVLCHCLWYFDCKTNMQRVFRAMRGKVKRLCIAEWSLHAASREANVHVLAALTHATCEAHVSNSDANIRTPVTPTIIVRLTAEAGWNLEFEKIWSPDSDLEDAKWEVGNLFTEGGHAKNNTFWNRATREIEDQRVLTLLECMQEGVKSAISSLDGDTEMRCMDVWVGNFA